ncbi:MAG: hypothetical protein ACPGNV_14200 [Mangrovicoccus sp.]
MKYERVFLVNQHGVAKAMDLRALGEQARIERVKALGAVPDGCSPEIPVAPARGPVRAFTPMKLYPSGEDEWELKASGRIGPDGQPIKSIQRADAFDLMTHRAQLAHKGKRAEFVPPFSPGQVAMGRHYRNLWERHASAGVRCSSAEALRAGGAGGGGGFIDAVLRDRDQIKRIRERIGDGFALEVRRQGKASKRSGITDRRLVDMVCLEEKTLTEVLRAHGWAKRGGNVATLQGALAEALNRMMGPDLRRSSYVIRDPDLPLGFGAFAEAVEESS